MNDINDLHQYAGRGRPRVENPLTQAERAKAYRDRKRADNLVKSDDIKTVTENLDKLPSYGMLESRIILLTAQNITLSAQIIALQAQIAKPKKAKK